MGFDFSLAKKELSNEELKELTQPLYEEFNLDKNIQFDKVIDEIIKIRKTARDNKDWQKSDEIRDKLLKHKIQLKDSKEGTSWTCL